LFAANLEDANPEGVVILEQLIFGIAVVAAVLLLLPFLLVMFPSLYGLAVLLLALVIGFLVLDRQYRPRQDAS
jgi:hypothetical protein